MSTAAPPAESPSLDAAIDQLLVSRWAPAHWPRISRIDDLPLRFEQLVRGLPAGTWRAHSDGVRFGFAVADFTRRPLPGGGCPDVTVTFYDPDARVCAAAIWTAAGVGRWRLREVLH
jgi:hypothetical protein